VWPATMNGAKVLDMNHAAGHKPSTTESLMRLARLTALACERLVGVAMLRVKCLQRCAGMLPAFATPNFKEACQKPAICQRTPRAPTHAEAFNNTLLYDLMARTCHILHPQIGLRVLKLKLGFRLFKTIGCGLPQFAPATTRCSCLSVSTQSALQSTQCLRIVHTGS